MLYQFVVINLLQRQSMSYTSVLNRSHVSSVENRLFQCNLHLKLWDLFPTSCSFYFLHWEISYNMFIKLTLISLHFYRGVMLVRLMHKHRTVHRVLMIVNIITVVHLMYHHVLLLHHMLWMTCLMIYKVVPLMKRYIYIYRVFFLFLVLFNLTSRSYFRSDFVDGPINLFTLLCAIEWGIDHNSIITLCRVTSQYIKAVLFVKIDFSMIELKFPIFEIIF